MNGLTEKPWWVRALAGLLWLNVLGMPLQVMVLYGHLPVEVTAIWAKIAPQNRLVMVLSATAALGVHRVDRWGWYAALSFAGVGLWNNWIVLHFPMPMPRWSVTAASACLALLALSLLRPSVCRLFHTRSLHWWRTAPRYRVDALVEIETVRGERLEGKLFDISRTGLFVQASCPGVEAGEVLRVRVHLEDRVLCCAARVVRRVGVTEIHPGGLGLRFSAVPLADRVWLRVGLSSVVA
ncbi:MAG: PilZ domain-containing protein [Proteobacteria bacterium]|nr:PilZ domain-containing protein [Pseudomonadota bacterium]